MIYALTVFALVALASAHSGPQLRDAFENFKEKYGKTYSSPVEHAKRLKIFAENFELVNQLNSEHLLLGGEAVHGITKFMDLTTEEFSAMYLTYTPRERTDAGFEFNITETATSVDWRTTATTPVKDQGACGSCWAFSATEAIESYAYLKGGYRLMKLSPQQITSCDSDSYGCDGGWTENAFDYVAQAGGIETESSYPYTSGSSGDTGKCKFSSSNTAVSIRGYTAVSRGESNLKKALNDGPVSICLAADAFQFYSSGVLKYCPGQIDHCVQAVGYDDSSADPYWVVRNSWANDWGENGYVRVAQGKNLCKLSDDVTFPKF